MDPDLSHRESFNPWHLWVPACSVRPEGGEREGDISDAYYHHCESSSHGIRTDVWITYNVALREGGRDVSDKKVSPRILHNRLRIADVLSMQFFWGGSRRGTTPADLGVSVNK